MDWLQVSVQLILTGILLYVFQRVIDERSAKRLKEFETNLRANAFENEIKFSKLHEKRIEALATLYKKLSNVRIALNHIFIFLNYQNQDAVIRSGNFSDLINKLSADINDFSAFYKDVSYCLPANLINQINDYYDHSIAILEVLTLSQVIKEGTIRIDNNQTIYRNLLDKSQNLTEKLESLDKTINEELSIILGNK